MTAVKTFIFWTAGKSWLSRLIIRITGRQLLDKSDAWSHMGLGFELEDGKRIYYEALFSEGFVGPKPMDKLLAFRDAGGKLSIQFTSIVGPMAERVRDRCVVWTVYKSYYAWQLVLMWAFERVGRFVGWRLRRTPGKVVCSEAVAALVWPFMDLRDEIRTEFDAVNPNSGWRKYQVLRQECESV